MPSSSSSSVRQRKLPGAESLVSLLLTQKEVDALCEKLGVPKEFKARPAGDLHVSSVPPPGAICVYAHALKAGMRVPLHGFFCQALAHFGIAPAQLTPNGWRIMAGFLALCHSAGVPPSLPVFRHLFTLSIVNHKEKGWYFFRSKDNSGLRFAGLPTPRSDWRKLFFFLSSTEPWPCPVEWGEPSKTSFVDPLLTDEESLWASKLLSAHGAAAIDLDTNLCGSDLAATASMSTTTPPAPPSTTHTTTSSPRGIDPQIYDMVKTMYAEKAAAQSAKKKVKAEPGSEAPVLPPLCGEKKGPEEANDGEESPPPTVVTGVFSPPPGFSGRHNRDNTDWEAARDLLHGAITPLQKRVFAATEPSGMVASSYATNYVSFCLGNALALEKKLAERDAEIAALREQLEETNGELAAAKRAEETERENAEATEAMQRLLVSEERVRRLAEHALEGDRDQVTCIQHVTLQHAPSPMLSKPHPKAQNDPRKKDPRTPHGTNTGARVF
ncbi:uncharacterized protein [Lolium perenne]|uniref:uncharacterized protein isoform X2 n=1 Tax=Lolium perenne TaxID=4522 RepID=UPI0021F698F4|nr:uncharacterized protein LOC127318019 isoform X2 [Lolium perenne]